jgi:hypothetical protein
MQENVCRIQSNLQDMQSILHWTNTTKLKDRMGQHLNHVKKLVTKGTKLDSFASNFAHHCKKEVKEPTSDELRKMMKVKIIWQGNAISCMKLFGKLNCSLCM